MDGRKVILEYALVCLCTLNSILHVFGAYLLIHIYRSGHKSVQQIYLINLSFIELVTCVCILVEECLPTNDVNSQIRTYLYAVIYVLLCAYNFGMVFITIDRLIATILHIKYPLYWDAGKASNTVVLSWIFYFIMCIAVCLAYKYTAFEFKTIFPDYVHSFLNFGYLALVMFTYAYLFYHYRKRRLNFTTSNDSSDDTSVCAAFCSSKFYVVVLLMISFLLFLVIPHIVYLFFNLSYELNDFYKDVFKVFYQISFLCDAIIYTFLHPDVRKTLLAKIWRRSRHSAVAPFVTSHAVVVASTQF